MTEKGVIRSDFVDSIEAAAADAINNNPEKFEAFHCEPEHLFTPGIYVRKFSVPAGKLVFSETHLTEHPFFVVDGVCEVFTEEEGWVLIKAPFQGVTKPGTRRILRIWADLIWVTVHATSLTSVKEIEETILDRSENPLLGGYFQNNTFVPSHNLITN